MTAIHEIRAGPGRDELLQVAAGVQCPVTNEGAQSKTHAPRGVQLVNTSS